VPEPEVPGTWRLAVAQDREGYRFSLDAFLLADFVPPSCSGPWLDLGTGCGIVALLLARRFPHLSIVGLELQPTLAASARQNVVRNGLQDRITILRADARQVHTLLPAARFGTVVCNPPYRAVGSGRLNPDAVRARARHELTLTQQQLVRACRHLLRPGGVLAMVYHPSRLPELCTRLLEAHLRPRRLRLVHSTPQEPASMVLLEAMRGGRHALTVLPPLQVYDDQGSYTPEMRAIFQGRSAQQ
jgi:tRNA1Val (adenine37-N6)-methyltransferase